jgi:hypothetical protein
MHRGAIRLGETLRLLCVGNTDPVRHGERTVTTFGLVCLIAAVSGYLDHAEAGWIRLAVISGVVMIVSVRGPPGVAASKAFSSMLDNACYVTYDRDCPL